MKRVATLGLLGILIAFYLPIKTAPKQETVIVKETKPVAQIEASQQPIEPTIVPEPIPEPTPVVGPVLPSGDCSLVNNYDWPRDIARAVCLAESGGNANATNWGDNHGKCVGSFSLMQVGCFWYPYFGYSEADFYNPVVNMEIAYRIYQRQGGFGAWSAYTKGAYLRYL